MGEKVWRFRGHNTFYFKRKRYPLDNLRSRKAEHRTCYPGGGGHWNGKTGNGEAFHKDGNIYGPWTRVRTIVAGQWVGPWRYVKKDQGEI